MRRLPRSLRASAACLIFALAFTAEVTAEAAEGPRPSHAQSERLARELIRAATRGEIAGVRSALDRGAPTDVVDAQGLRGTALEKAAANGHREVVELLLARGATIRFDPGTGLYAAHWAAVDGHGEILRLLIEKAEPEDLDAALSSALVAAAYQGHADIVTDLLDLGVHVDATPARPRMQTALEASAERGHLELTAFLLDRGAQVRVVETLGVAAATGVAAYGDIELLRRIADAHVATAERHEESRVLYGPALAQASRSGHAAAVALLLELGADPDFSGRHGLIFYTDDGQRIGAAPLAPLTLAAEQARWAVVDVLLEAGAQVERSELLQFAASWGNLPLVRRLLQDGVDIQTQGRFGNAMTALAYAPLGPKRDVEATALFLIEQGIDANVPFNGRRPINWAKDRGDVELARLLEEHGASEGTTVAYKFRQLRRSLAGVAMSVVLLFGGSM